MKRRCWYVNERCSGNHAEITKKISKNVFEGSMIIRSFSNTIAKRTQTLSYYCTSFHYIEKVDTKQGT